MSLVRFLFEDDDGRTFYDMEWWFTHQPGFLKQDDDTYDLTEGLCDSKILQVNWLIIPHDITDGSAEHPYGKPIYNDPTPCPRCYPDESTPAIRELFHSYELTAAEMITP